MPPRVMEYVVENSLVLSPLYGLVKPTACIPYAPLGWKELYQGKTLFDFWKEHIKNLSRKLFKDKVLVLSFQKSISLSLTLGWRRS